MNKTSFGKKYVCLLLFMLGITAFGATPIYESTGTMTFDGTNYVDTGAYAYILWNGTETTRALTVTVKFKATSIGTTQTIMSYGAGNKKYVGMIKINAAGQLKIGYKNHNCPSILIQQDKWYDITVVYPLGSSNLSDLKLYINGTEAPMGTPTAYDADLLRAASIWQPLNLGRDGKNNATYFTGEIKDVKIYNDELTDDEIATDAGFSLSISTNANSAVSPAFVEGANIPSLGATLTANDIPVTITMLNSANWYADNTGTPNALPGITLNPNNSTALVLTDGTTTVNQTLTWTATEIAGNTSITIRKGDSLLLTSSGTGTLEIDPDYDSTNPFSPGHTGTAGDQFVNAFNTAGIFFVKANVAGVEAGILTVIVVDVNLNGSTACQIGYSRVKTIDINGAGYPDVSFVSNNLLSLSLKEDTATGCDLYLEPITSGIPSYHCRLGGDSGPIIVNQDVDEFDLTSTAAKWVSIIQEFPDGSVLVEPDMFMTPQILGLEVRINIFVSGVTFEDSTTDKTVLSDDFTGTGNTVGYAYRMIMNANVTTGACHKIKTYQNNIQIGEL